MKLLACSLLALAACATDNADFTAKAQLVEGIYRVDGHQRNETSCAAGGDAVSGTHTFAFAKRISFQDLSWLQVFSCASLDQCRTAAAAAQFEGVTEFDFALSDIDGDQLVGEGASSGFTDGSMCRAPEAWDTTLELVGEELRIAKSIRVGRDYKAQDGFCTTELGREAAEDAACSQRETLTATLLERF